MDETVSESNAANEDLEIQPWALARESWQCQLNDTLPLQETKARTYKISTDWDPTMTEMTHKGAQLAGIWYCIDMLETHAILSMVCVIFAEEIVFHPLPNQNSFSCCESVPLWSLLLKVLPIHYLCSFFIHVQLMKYIVTHILEESVQTSNNPTTVLSKRAKENRSGCRGYVSRIRASI